MASYRLLGVYRAWCRTLVVLESVFRRTPYQLNIGFIASMLSTYKWKLVRRRPRTPFPT